MYLLFRYVPKSFEGAEEGVLLEYFLTTMAKDFDQVRIEKTERYTREYKETLALRKQEAKVAKAKLDNTFERVGGVFKSEEDRLKYNSEFESIKERYQFQKNRLAENFENNIKGIAHKFRISAYASEADVAAEVKLLGIQDIFLSYRVDITKGDIVKEDGLYFLKYGEGLKLANPRCLINWSLELKGLATRIKEYEGMVVEDHDAPEAFVKPEAGSLSPAESPFHELSMHDASDSALSAAETGISPTLSPLSTARVIGKKPFVAKKPFVVRGMTSMAGGAPSPAYYNSATSVRNFTGRQGPAAVRSAARAALSFK